MAFNLPLRVFMEVGLELMVVCVYALQHLLKAVDLTNLVPACLVLGCSLVLYVALITLTL